MHLRSTGFSRVVMMVILGYFCVYCKLVCFAARICSHVFGLAEGNAMRLVFVAVVMADVYDQHLKILSLLELPLFQVIVPLLCAVGSFLLPDDIIRLFVNKLLDPLTKLLHIII